MGFNEIAQEVRVDMSRLRTHRPARSGGRLREPLAMSLLVDPGCLWHVVRRPMDWARTRMHVFHVVSRSICVVKCSGTRTSWQSTVLIGTV